jgi:hypothetical protein
MAQSQVILCIVGGSGPSMIRFYVLLPTIHCCEPSLDFRRFGKPIPRWHSDAEVQVNQFASL